MLEGAATRPAPLRVDVTRGRRWTAIAIDLEHCGFDLNDAGAYLCRLRILEAHPRNGSAFGTAPSYVYAEAVPAGAAERLVESLVAIIEAPELHAPLLRPRRWAPPRAGRLGGR